MFGVHTKMNHKVFILGVLCIFFALAFFLKTGNEESIMEKYLLTMKNKIGPLDSEFPITFYHNAYVDFRYSTPKLRIFALNGCIRNDNFILVDVYHKGALSPTRLQLFGKPLEKRCPSPHRPAKSCFYAPHTFLGDVSTEREVEKVTVHLGNRKVKLTVQEVHKRLEPGLTMCSQPVYYYSHWQNIVLYVEAWKAQGASRFIVFYHSSDKETKRVLDYYQNLGIIELRPWPSFGALPTEIADKYPKIDDSVFIFSHLLAENLCILDIKTTIGAVADFDEVMVPPKDGTVLEYALNELTDTNIGAVTFGNNYVAMEPSIYTSDFSGVGVPIFTQEGGPNKYIFNSSVIEVAQIHHVANFTEPKKTKKGDGGLLHLRFNMDSKNVTVPQKSFRFFPNNTSEHIKNMQETARVIFNGTLPTFNPSLIHGVNDCVRKISEKGNTCRSTGGLCKADMDKLYDWVYDQTKGLFLSGA